MILFKRPRRAGKTTALIHTSAVTGYPIIVGSHTELNHVKKMAEEMSLDIPEPVTLSTYQQAYRGKRFQGLLIDNLDNMLPKILSEYFNAPIMSASYTDFENKLDSDLQTYIESEV